jgi:hypothetical protein
VNRFQETAALVKRHPYATAGAVFVGGAVLVYVYYSSGSATPAPAADAAQLDFIKAQLISESTQAQYGAQLGALQSQEKNVATQVQGAVAIDSNRNAAQVSIATLLASVQKQQLDTAKVVDLSQIAATQALGLAQTSAGVTHDQLLYGFMNTQSHDAAQTATNQAYFASLTATKVAEFAADSSMYASGAAAYTATFSKVMADQLAAIQASKERINA